MKDREQNLGNIGKIGRFVAATGLFMASCGQYNPEPVKGSVKGHDFEITQLSDHVYEVGSSALWRFQSDPARDAAMDFLKKRCMVELVIDTNNSAWKKVVTKDPNCIPEIRPSQQ